MTAAPPRLALTTGEPAGIGPDLALALAAVALDARLAVLADPRLLADRAQQLGTRVRIETLERIGDAPAHRAGTLHVVPVPTAEPVVPGELNTANAASVLEQLRRACDACVAGDADAIVTAPVQKSVIAQSGVPFSGHTEFFAERVGAQPVMLLAGEQLRVALVTTHLPLRDVPAAITVERIERTATILAGDLERRFGIASPRVLVLGLNPHAGEQGTLGREELEIIEPALARLSSRGIRAIGPVSADTAFTSESLERCDAVLAMYHDQGLAPLKALSFGRIVNVTLGLPIIRTSVDHGTALALAGTGGASAHSLQAAVELARELVLHSRAGA